LWNGSEAHIEDALYDTLSSVDFSRDVLSPQAARLLAVRLEDIGWSDLGRPERVMSVLKKADLQPWWMKPRPNLGPFPDAIPKQIRKRDWAPQEMVSGLEVERR
jgi:hypothetical protein